MHITRAVLTGYYPLSLHDINQITLDFTAPVQVFIGDNGSGKSSVMRELSPGAAISTSYPSGKRTIELTHRGVDYRLISDFTTKKGVHQFLRNGEELNLSNTSGVQRSLASSELGWTDEVAALCQHKIRICGMGRSERRNCFVGLCPSNIEFVAQKHRKALSVARTLQGTLKQVQAEEALLANQQMTEHELAIHQSTKTQLTALIGELDAAIVRVDRELRDLGEVSTPLDLTAIAQEATDLRAAATTLRIQHDDLFRRKNLELEEQAHQSAIRQAQQLLADCSNRISTIVAQLNEYQTMLDDDHEQIEQELTSVIAALQLRVADLPAHPDLPEVTQSELDNLEALVPRLRQGIENLDGQIWPSAVLPLAQHRLSSWRQHHLELREQREHFRTQADWHRSELVNLHTPADGCTRKCPLLDNYQNTANQYHRSLAKLDADIAQLTAKLKHSKTRIIRLETAVTEVSSGLPIIKAFEQTFLPSEWGNYVLRNRNLYRVLRTVPSDLVNGLQRFILCTKQSKERERCQRELQQKQDQLTALREVKRPARDVLIRVVEENQSTLAKLHQQEAELERSLALHDQQLTTTQQTQRIRRRTLELQRLLMTHTQEQLNAQLVKFWDETKAELQRGKRELLIQLGKVEHTLREQDNLASRLHEGLQPMSIRIGAQLTAIQAIEPILSPTTGIPKQHLVRFINCAIQKTNELIAEVWSYDLRINLLDPQADLNFELSATINGDGHIPELGLLSSGQQEIVDLAFTVTLGEVAHIFDEFPLFLDEPDKSIAPGSQERILVLLAKLLNSNRFSQLFLVNHHAQLYTAFGTCEICCLKPDNIVLPPTYNEHVQIV